MSNLTSKTMCIAVAALLLAGCEPPKSNGYIDQDVRREVFLDCLRTVPAGPEHTRYNDWSEVVAECGEQALWMAKRGYVDTRAAEKVEKQ